MRLWIKAGGGRQDWIARVQKGIEIVTKEDHPRERVDTNMPFEKVNIISPPLLSPHGQPNALYQSMMQESASGTLKDNSMIANPAKAIQNIF